MKKEIKIHPSKSAPKEKRARVGHGALQSTRDTKESAELVLALRRGKIDALLRWDTDGEEGLTPQGAKHPFRVPVETIHDGVATLDLSGVVLYANSRFAAILGVPVEKLVGTSLQGYVSALDRERLENLIAGGLINSAEGEITLDDGEGRPRLVRVALNPVKNSIPQTLCIVATELTELVEANEALRSNEESLRALSVRLLKLQDEERRHIARDLHDITGQKLAVQSMLLSQVLNRKPSVLDAESRRILQECSGLSKQIGEEIRTLSYLLHPPFLDELGLSSAVKWYAEGFERRTGIQVRVDVDEFDRLAPDMEVTLFRVIQESLTNVHRHAESAQAFVRVKVMPGKIEAQIGDFGKGICPGVLRPRTGRVATVGVGIQGMKERVRQLAGILKITSKPNQGTLVTAILPIGTSNLSANSEPTASASTILRENSSKSSSPHQNTSRKQILVADDEEDGPPRNSCVAGKRNSMGNLWRGRGWKPNH